MTRDELLHGACIQWHQQLCPLPQPACVYRPDEEDVVTFGTMLDALLTAGAVVLVPTNTLVFGDVGMAECWQPSLIVNTLGMERSETVQPSYVPVGPNK